MRKCLKFLIPFSLFILVTGCTVISNNRVFPKLAPFWTNEAKEQRKSNAAHEKAQEEYIKSQHLVK